MLTGAETTIQIGDRDIGLRFNFATLERIEKQLGSPLHSWFKQEKNLYKVGKLMDIFVTGANAVKGQEPIDKAFLMENLEGDMLADVISLITFVVGGDERRDAYRKARAKEAREEAREDAKEAAEDLVDESAPVEPDPL